MSTPLSITPHDFGDKWRSATLKERSAYQEHFIDLCRLIGHPTPAEVDPTGENFAFEYGAAKTTGGHGFADVFKRRCFALEYKGKHADLDKAYQQLLNYREALQNPPLLVVCDIDRLIIHTNFTNTRKRTRTLLLDDLLTQAGRQALRAVFEQPAFFEQIELPAQVTQQAADRFATLAAHLRATLPDTSSQTIAHFLIRCLFCLFAEDVDLLHNNVFTKLVEQGRVKSDRFTAQVRQLFAAMATGGYFGVEDIRHFDGGLFNDDAAAAPTAATPPIDRHAIEILAGFVFAREDDYFLGVLHSSIHEIWSLATSSRHGDGSEGGRPTYNNGTCFETFPFPWPPGREPAKTSEVFIDDQASPDSPSSLPASLASQPVKTSEVFQARARERAIARAAKELNELREAWLNPPDISDVELKKRTLTNLYNARPTWLDNAHRWLDAAVFGAYGWPSDLSDDEILARLLALNLERVAT